MLRTSANRLPPITKKDIITENEKIEKKNINISVPLKDSLYKEFLRQLTVSKVIEFTELCKQKELESLKRNMKLKKNAFLNIMRTCFPEEDYFDPLFEQIFNRFKIIKAEIRSPNKKDNYFLSRFFSEDEIDMYEICCALACFVKCDFEQKIKLLFDITDIDDDGFINQKEVKKLILTINILFSDERKNHNNDSTIAAQSIASIHSMEVIKEIMGFPGQLGKTLHDEKYINFQQFLESFTQLYNYKYDILPLFVNLKASLFVEKKEKEFELKYKNLNDYTEISNDIISNLKNDNMNLIGKSNIDFKKRLERIRKKTRNKQSIGISASISNNSKSLLSNIIINKKNTSEIKDNKKSKDEIIYTINSNDICGLETLPGQIKLTEIHKNENQKPNLIHEYVKKSIISRYINYNSNNNININNSNSNIDRRGYMSLNEVLSEIQTISNKHRAAEQIPEQMLAIEKEVKEIAADTALHLKDRNPNGNLQFGLFERKKKKLV